MYAQGKNKIFIANATNKTDGPFYCIECKEELILKKGKIKIPHFSHKGNSNCTGESSEHILAKKFIIDNLGDCKFNSTCNVCDCICDSVVFRSGCYLPDMDVSGKKVHDTKVIQDKKVHNIKEIQDKKVHNIKEIQDTNEIPDKKDEENCGFHIGIPEYKIGKYIVDICIKDNNDKIVGVIEIFYKHKTDITKIRDLRKICESVIELNAVDVISTFLSSKTKVLDNILQPKCLTCLSIDNYAIEKNLLVFPYSCIERKEIEIAMRGKYKKTYLLSDDLSDLDRCIRCKKHITNITGNNVADKSITNTIGKHTVYCKDCYEFIALDPIEDEWMEYLYHDGKWVDCFELKSVFRKKYMWINDIDDCGCVSMLSNNYKLSSTNECQDSKYKEIKIWWFGKTKHICDICLSNKYITLDKFQELENKVIELECCLIELMCNL